MTPPTRPATKARANAKLNHTFGTISNSYKRIMKRRVCILTFVSLMDAGRWSRFWNLKQIIIHNNKIIWSCYKEAWYNWSLRKSCIPAKKVGECVFVNCLWLPLLTHLVSPFLRNSFTKSNYRYPYVEKTSDLWNLLYQDKTNPWHPKRSGFYIQNKRNRYGLSTTRTFVAWWKFKLLPTYQRHMIQPSNRPPTTFYLQTMAIYWCGVKYISFPLVTHYKAHSTGDPWIVIHSGNSQGCHTREPQKVPIVWYSIYRPWLAK